MAKKAGRPGKKKEKLPPPKCKAILLCDQTIAEIGTGKVSLIGTFARFILPKFPGYTAPCSIFLQLTDGIGQYDINAELRDLQNAQILARSPTVRIEFPSRLTRINLTLPISRLPLQGPGLYDIVVFADGQEIDRQQFEAVASRG